MEVNQVSLRTPLHEKLVEVLSGELDRSVAEQRVFYQPPEGYKLEYPCIIYELSKRVSIHANNKNYLKNQVYSIKYITENSDSDIPELLEETLDNSSFERVFTTEGLYHYIYKTYI